MLYYDLRDLLIDRVGGNSFTFGRFHCLRLVGGICYVGLLDVSGFCFLFSKKKSNALVS